MKSPITYNFLTILNVMAVFSALFVGKLDAVNEPIKVSLEITGGHIVVNDDDENDNQEWDWTESPTLDKGLIGPKTPEKNEPKLQKFSFTAKHTHEPGVLVINASSSKYIKLWKDADKSASFVPESSYPVGISQDTIVEFFVEGLEATPAFDLIEFTANFTVRDKTIDGRIKFGVTQADIDVDSDNNAGLKAIFTDEDDKIEFSGKSEHLGKIILENKGDVDSDGIVDSVDGLSLPNSPNSNAVAGLKLTPMLATLRPPFNPETAMVKFTYKASIPRLGGDGDIIADGGLVDGIQNYVVKKKGIRLWKVDGSLRKSGKDVGSQSGGDFIPAGKDIPWKDVLKEGEGTTTVIYIEYVDSESAQKTYAKEDIVLTVTDSESAKNGYIEILGKKTLLPGKESPDGLTVSLLPVEAAPKVLKVNANFDEGRLDPATGYAIPDCYDVGDSLRAERDHLDGLYAKDEVITNDLHKGWFGVKPDVMDAAFWDESIVTIKKIAKPDTTYGGNQEGNVRFYATWEDVNNGGGTAYQVINTYDLTSLTPTNLVGSVYGSTANIPADAQFWIEGIRGGKITLEWKYKKGDVELVFEQEFLVATEQSKQDWIDEIVYEIRLQSSDDIGGEVDITTFATSGLPSFAANKEQLFEMYDYYPELFLQTYGVDAADRDEVMAWYGLARCTTAEIVGGLAVMEDVYIKAPTAASVTSSFGSPILGPLLGYLSAHSRSTIREIQQALYLGAWDIFVDLAWQGRAYRASGIYALEYVDSIRPVIDFRFDGWNDIDRGRRAGNIPRIRIGVQTLADREQNIVVQPAFTVVQGISVYPSWPASVNADDVFSLLAENPVPGGISFGDWRGWSLLKNVAVAGDRWDWAIHAPDGIIPQWYTKTPAQHEALDLEHIEVRGRDFHARKYWPGEEYLLESEWKNDRPSRPHIKRY